MSRNIGYLDTSSQLPADPQDVEPGFGPGADRLTSSAGRTTGSGRNNVWSNSEKIAAFAPIPSASERMATRLTNGVLRRRRTASLRFMTGSLTKLEAE